MKRDENLDPDVRFLLANERTLLAWVRTALGMVAGGLILIHFDGSSDLQKYIGIGAALTGAATACVGYIRFRAADRAIRQGVLPDKGHGPLVLVWSVIILAIVITAIELSDLL